jgi:hypothetical protein
MKKRVPDYVICPKCQRRLDVRDYAARPSEKVPEERITRIFDPTVPMFSVACSTCVHYIVSTPFESQTIFKN